MTKEQRCTFETHHMMGMGDTVLRFPFPLSHKFPIACINTFQHFCFEQLFFSVDLAWYGELIEDLKRV